MFSIFVAVLVIVYVLHSCNSQREETNLVEEVYKMTENGYHFRYTTNDGLRRYETGVFAPTDDGGRILRVLGNYQYYGAEGKKYSISYTADENGYLPREITEETTEYGLAEHVSDTDVILGNRIGTSLLKTLTGGNSAG